MAESELNGSESVRSVVRAVSILEAIAAANGDRIGIQNLAKATKLSKATAYRIATTLVNLEYIEKDENNKYSLGLKLITLSSVILNNLQVLNVAKDELVSLSQEVELTAHLGTLDGNDLLYLSKANTNASIQTTSYVGQRSYVHSTSLGKALCAQLTSDEVLQILDDKGMPRFTDHTITDPAAYLKDLEQVRCRGYAIDNEENEKFVRCVAAPVFDHSGKTIAAISVSGLIVHVPEEKLVALAEIVRGRASKISAKMGYHT